MEDPPLLAKVILIGFAIATSAASYYKLQEDEENKKFLQLALTATLIPSNSDYAAYPVQSGLPIGGSERATCRLTSRASVASMFP